MGKLHASDILLRHYLSIVLVAAYAWVGQTDRLIFNMDLWLGRHCNLVVGH